MPADVDALARIKADHPFGATRRYVGETHPEMREKDLRVLNWRIDAALPQVFVAVPAESHLDRWVLEINLIPREQAPPLGAEALRDVGWANGTQPAPSALGDTSDETGDSGDVGGRVLLDALRPTGYVDGNPKTAAGARKPPMGAIPGPALLALGMAMEDGKVKYGLTNWREFPVTVSTYTNAAQRHILEFLDGETFDRKSGIIQLGHVMACCAIVIDAMAQGTITDDRTKFPGQTSDLIEAIMEGKPNAICNPR